MIFKLCKRKKQKQKPPQLRFVRLCKMIYVVKPTSSLKTIPYLTHITQATHKACSNKLYQAFKRMGYNKQNLAYQYNKQANMRGSYTKGCTCQLVQSTLPPIFSANRINYASIPTLKQGYEVQKCQVAIHVITYHTKILTAHHFQLFISIR